MARSGLQGLRRRCDLCSLYRLLQAERPQKPSVQSMYDFFLDIAVCISAICFDESRSARPTVAACVIVEIPKHGSLAMLVHNMSLRKALCLLTWILR